MIALLIKDTHLIYIKIINDGIKACVQIIQQCHHLNRITGKCFIQLQINTKKHQVFTDAH